MPSRQRLLFQHRFRMRSPTSPWSRAGQRWRRFSAGPLSFGAWLLLRGYCCASGADGWGYLLGWDQIAVGVHLGRGRPCNEDAQVGPIRDAEAWIERHDALADGGGIDVPNLRSAARTRVYVDGLRVTGCWVAVDVHPDLADNQCLTCWRSGDSNAAMCAV